MISLSDLFGVLLLGIGLAYWLHARDLKEWAVMVARRHCRELELEFLDETVVLRSMRLQRDRRGRLGLLRIYGFEFSSTGDDRYWGQIQVLGRQVLAIELEPHRI